MVLALGMQKNWPPEIGKALQENRLLIISPFPEDVTRVSEKTAGLRNQTILKIADEIIVAHASSGGLIENMLINVKKVKWISGG
ncbi:MAG: hypothetical protein JW976_07815 [Syntrophaceae bacterium]|nr:hypothetical protein [Syntrophaceae bacterium]